MRTIKFRGLRTDGKGWVYGYLVIDPIGLHRIYWKPFLEATSNTYHFVTEKTLGQFTGLHDKNGKEIYEGDILDSSEKIPMIFEVYYQDGGFRYGKKDRSVDISFSGHNWLQNILKRFHVIGNIHKNPELLK